MTTTAPVPVSAPVATTTGGEQKKFNVGRAAAWVFMGLVILASLFPFYWILRARR
jgi:multiple sugar transport system permease protein